MMNLTREERKVVLFLVMIALLGAGVSSGLKQFGAGKTAASFSGDLGKVDLNRADKRALVGISGIGERLAQRIIDYRDASAGFDSLEELREVKGIHDSKFARIKEYLIVK